MCVFISASDRVKPVQSPIALSSLNSKVIDNIRPLEFHGYFENDGQAYIENTGISAKITFEGRNKQPYICGGTLKSNERYFFNELHFHWSEKDDSGCEHKINGQK